MGKKTKIKCVECGKEFEGLTEKQALRYFNMHYISAHMQKQRDSLKESDSPDTHNLEEAK